MEKENPKVLINSEYIEDLKNNITYKYVEENDFLRINWKDDFCNVYSYGLGAILASKEIPSTLIGTDERFVFNGKIYIPNYYNGFLKGRKCFIDDFRNNQFQNRDTIVKTLDRFYNDEIIEGNFGWKGYIKGKCPQIISDEITFKWGFYNGMIYELKDFVRLNEEMFRDFYRNNKSKVILCSNGVIQKPNRTDIAYYIYYVSTKNYKVLEADFPTVQGYKELGELYNINWTNIQKKYLEILKDRDMRIQFSRKKNIEFVIDNMLKDYPEAMKIAKSELDCL